VAVLRCGPGIKDMPERSLDRVLMSREARQARRDQAVDLLVSAASKVKSANQPSARLPADQPNFQSGRGRCRLRLCLACRCQG
jgi:hypothetical protein